jgi:hypothetical protein
LRWGGGAAGDGRLKMEDGGSRMKAELQNGGA